jgi:hypothetical protein
MIERLDVSSISQELRNVKYVVTFNHLGEHYWSYLQVGKPKALRMGVVKRIKCIYVLVPDAASSDQDWAVKSLRGSEFCGPVPESILAGGYLYLTQRR